MRSEMARGHRAYIGRPEIYDLQSGFQFSLLVFLGLREHHELLDIGCGSLRAGRFFILYLLPGRYFGLEPEAWLIEQGIQQEIGSDLIRLKRPIFRHEADFTLSAFGRPFDFLLAQSIFSHASARQIRRCLAEAKRVMKPEAVFAATFVEGAENYTGEEWVAWDYPGYATYTLARMRELAEAEGLSCTPVEWPHPEQQRWLVFTHAGHRPALPSQEDPLRKTVDLEQALAHSRHEQRLAQVRLEQIERHPYVRTGLAVHRWWGVVQRRVRSLFARGSQ